VNWKYICSAALFILISCKNDLPSEIAKTIKDIPDEIDYNFHVKPILSDRCYACHGPDDNTREAELRFDIIEEAISLVADDGSQVIDQGNPANSKLIRHILSEEPDYMMPPPDSELSLSDTEKAILYKWIKQGAVWKKHWAFIPPERSDKLPKADKNWCNNEIDFFINNVHKQKGLSHAAKAPKEQWLRRVTFDLTGLPPLPEDVIDFNDDKDSDAYEKVVDRLLSDPAYGERMASVWLDVARYADSHGYQDDRPRTSWPWRDWVINAFNANMPYDQFATWQLAGDLLPNSTYEQRLATGFNRNHAITQEGGVVQEEHLTEYAADRTHTFSTAFLGLTMECARCHNHKYDPLSQKEYYSLFSFFNNIKEKGQISYFDEAPTPNMELNDPVFDAKVEEVKEWLSIKKEELAQIEKNEQSEFGEWLSSNYNLQGIKSNLLNGLISHFDFNKNDQDLYQSIVPNSPEAQLNINLPPEIPLPIETQGRSGQALKFDGKNHFSLGDVGDFEWYNQFSFGGWIKHSNKHDKDAGIFSRRVGEQKRQGYDLVISRNNRLAVRLIHQYVKKNKWSGDINLAIDVRTRNKLSAQNWHHVFVTYDGSGMANGVNIYINGQQQGLNVVMDSLQQKTILTGNDFLAGNWNHRARETDQLYGFKGGSVDEVMVFNRELSPVEVKLLSGTPTPPSRQDKYKHYLSQHSVAYDKTIVALDSLRRIDLVKPHVMIMEELDSIKPTFVLDRGAYDAKTDSVFRTTPAAVLSFSDQLPNNRLGLAQWLFDKEHPLTSRVIVNRFWQLFFGRGIVATPEDFGNQGALPTHPLLLDWLAVDFRESGWDIKSLIRKIVLSSTYRQDSKYTTQLLEEDKDNIWLARGPSLRLTAEMLRDQAIVSSGLYYEKIGGKWVKPYQPKGIWKELANQIGENKYRQSSGQDLYRRSLYGYWKRTIPPPTMLTFDASERAICTVKRQETSTPLQSLIMLNDPMYVEASRRMAESIIKQKMDEDGMIKQAFNNIVNRQALSEELRILNSIYAKELQRFNADQTSAKKLVSIGASNYDFQLDIPKLAAMTVVVSSIFNLDEAKYK